MDGQTRINGLGLPQITLIVGRNVVYAIHCILIFYILTDMNDHVKWRHLKYRQVFEICPNAQIFWYTSYTHVLNTVSCWSYNVLSFLLNYFGQNIDYLEAIFGQVTQHKKNCTFMQKNASSAHVLRVAPENVWLIISRCSFNRMLCWTLFYKRYHFGTYFRKFKYNSSMKLYYFIGISDTFIIQYFLNIQYWV